MPKVGMKDTRRQQLIDALQDTAREIMRQLGGC